MAEVSIDMELFRRYVRLMGDNVVAFWPCFEQNPGAGEDLEDWSTNAMHITNIVDYDDVPYIRGSQLAHRFNGVDEYWEHADHDIFSFGGDGTAPNEVCVTMGLWFNCRIDRLDIELMTKYDSVTTAREWRLYLDNAGHPSFQIWDEANAAAVGREYGTPYPLDEWHFLVGRYSGGGVEAGVDILLDGVVVDDATASAGGGYAGMNNTNTVVEIMAGQTAAGPVASGFGQGDIWGPFIADHPVLPDANILEMYRVGRRLLEV